MAFSPCFDLYFLQPVLSSHLAIRRGWPLNTGSTVLTSGSFWACLMESYPSSFNTGELWQNFLASVNVRAVVIMTIIAGPGSYCWTIKGSLKTREYEIMYSTSLKNTCETSLIRWGHQLEGRARACTPQGGAHFNKAIVYISTGALTVTH